jgi:hypothetical protein
MQKRRGLGLLRLGGRLLSSKTTGKTSKLSRLREILSVQNYDAFLLSMSDPHLSEYISDCFERMKYISGFSGSAGTVVVTSTDAFLWTDGRYHLQAEMELDPTEWKLMKGGCQVRKPLLDEPLNDLYSLGNPNLF